VQWLAYRTREQFLELMALLKSLGDQIRCIRIPEPPGIQLQDLVDRPIRQRIATKGSKFESAISPGALTQMRICDVPGCLEHTHLWGETCRFNLVLIDPIADLLEEEAPWRGVAGEYVVTAGGASGAEPGSNAVLPTLRASVGAFSRLWMGVRPATGLALTDNLAGPPELLEQLDRAFCLPAPHLDWEF
jgi:hypothetical protein